MIREISRLLRSAHPGAHQTVTGHVARGARIAAAIKSRWGLQTARQWQAKHMRWILERWCPSQGFSSATRYDYWRTVRALAAALRRWSNWQPYLHGPWEQIGIGGRRPKLAGRHGTKPSMEVPMAAQPAARREDRSHHRLRR